MRQGRHRERPRGRQDRALPLVDDELDLLLHRHGRADLRVHLVLAVDAQDDVGLELRRVAAGHGLGVAVDHADLRADLVDVNQGRVAALLVGLGESEVGLAEQLADQERRPADLGALGALLHFRGRYDGGDTVQARPGRSLPCRARFRSCRRVARRRTGGSPPACRCRRRGAAPRPDRTSSRRRRTRRPCRGTSAGAERSSKERCSSSRTTRGRR